MKTKLILTALLTGMVLINNFQLTAQKQLDSNPFSIIQVINNQQESTITLAWNDNRFEEIEIHNQDGLFIPSIPVLNAKQMHLNDLAEGDYLVIFKKQNEVIATKEFKVVSNEDMAKN
ncbi:MAG: hypothetical protein ACOVQG_01690 [Crocinitomicaceae bacterium]|jgi:hypothetical protein